MIDDALTLTLWIVVVFALLILLLTMISTWRD